MTRRIADSYFAPGAGGHWRLWWDWVKACRAGKRTARQRQRVRAMDDDTQRPPWIVDPKAQ